MHIQADRTPPQWLVGAFIVLFGVTLAAVIPGISAGPRGPLTASGTSQSAPERIVVRAKLFKFSAAVQPSTSGANDFLAASVGSSPVLALSVRLPSDLTGTARQITDRGIKIRAPPTTHA